MHEIYVIAWSGGYEAPSYEVRETEVDAWRLAEDWASDAPETDWIEVLRIDLDDKKIRALRMVGRHLAGGIRAHQDRLECDATDEDGFPADSRVSGEEHRRRRMQV